MNLQIAFASQVLDAARAASSLNAFGIDQSESDQLDCAISDLWEAGRALGYSPAEIAAIVARHVRFDADGRPWPREPDATNVVPIGLMRIQREPL